MEPKSCKLQIVPASKRKQRRLSHGFVVDPTTAASERSSVKKRLIGSRRRGSGIKNRHRSRTVSKTSLRGVEAGSRRMRVQGRFRGSRGKDVHNMKARSQDL